MELKLRNGDYVPDGLGGFQRQTGSEALLSRALFLLTARRGAFPFLPELGSQLWRLREEKPSGRDMAALQYAQEALADLDVLVRYAVVTAGENQTARVAVTVLADGETRDLEVTV